METQAMLSLSQNAAELRVLSLSASQAVLTHSKSNHSLISMSSSPLSSTVRFSASRECSFSSPQPRNLIRPTTFPATCSIPASASLTDPSGLVPSNAAEPPSRSLPRANSFLSSPPLSSSRSVHVASSASSSLPLDAALLDSGAGSGTGGGSGNGDGNGAGGNWGGGESNDDATPSQPGQNIPIVGAIVRGWNERIAADPQFIFKVLTEQIIGVSACVAGDMASRPNFGLSELDFVFSTLVVGSIVNFLLMYILAPTSLAGSAASSFLPGIFSSCPPGHMFEPGSYSLLARGGTFVYKGLVFAAAGFCAGLLGTAISNLLLTIRKKVQPDFVLQNTPPDTLMNATTWGVHLGLSSNLRYQALTAFDILLAQKLPPSLFKIVVYVIHGANNVIGGSTFVMLAKAMGSQQSGESSSEDEVALPPKMDPPPIVIAA
eukprot:TRINITY_DN7941_c0_g1_i1.p1 TRINITY_DN7941_c0_g1~~TRINITY_DN7941_c0_g1_i1.p1  ORF type:complete len:433 (+),score=62.99 TRINITY_DN7941_c0_g1_i1:88-1386(+)